MRCRPYVAALAVLVVAAPARAEKAHDFTIARGPLGSVLIALGRQADVNIGLTDPALALRASKGVRGRRSVKAALRIALRDTGADFAFVDSSTVRVFAAVLRRDVARRERPVRDPPVPPRVEREIVVTASKQATALSRYPATATVLDLQDEPGAREAAQGTAALVTRLT